MHVPEVAPELGVIDAHVRRRLKELICIVAPEEATHASSTGICVPAKVSRKAAAGTTAYCGKGSWPKSNRPRHDEEAYPPAWFRERMVSLKAARWERDQHPTGHRPAHAGTLISTQGAGCGTARSGSVRGVVE